LQARRQLRGERVLSLPPQGPASRDRRLNDISRISPIMGIHIRTFFDVGAWHGQVSECALTEFPDAQVIAFELRGIYVSREWSTAAHLANMSARMAGVILPAKVLKQGSLDELDLSLLLVDHKKLPTSMKLPRMRSCLKRGPCGDHLVDFRRVPFFEADPGTTTVFLR
jgi:hypothetical protein